MKVPQFGSALYFFQEVPMKPITLTLPLFALSLVFVISSLAEDPKEGNGGDIMIINPQGAQEIQLIEYAIEMEREQDRQYHEAVFKFIPSRLESVREAYGEKIASEIIDELVVNSDRYKEEMSRLSATNDISQVATIVVLKALRVVTEAK
jgi:hypothetical protein